jgi:Ribosomal protein L4
LLDLQENKKQKGTGGARAGSVKSGTRVGGGEFLDHVLEITTSN